MRRFAIALFVTSSIAAAACGGSSPTAPSAETLAGTWRATRAEFVSQANVRVEVVSRGVVLVLVLAAGGSGTLTVTEPGAAAEVFTGTWHASTDVLTMTWTSGLHGNSQFDMTLSGNTLTLSGGHVMYDVDGNDVDDEAVLNITLVRQ
jgi:hypothetical protein